MSTCLLVSFQLLWLLAEEWDSWKNTDLCVQLFCILVGNQDPWKTFILRLLHVHVYNLIVSNCFRKAILSRGCPSLKTVMCPIDAYSVNFRLKRIVVS